MLRNVASQKYRVYAWDVTTGFAKTGDAANITGIITKDDGTPAATNDTNPTEANATTQKGYYDFDLTQAETNAAKVSLSPQSSTSNIAVIACAPVVYTRPQYASLLGIESDGDLTKVNTLHGHTAQTGDNFARTGAPAGASISADIAAVKTVADGTKAKTDNLPATPAAAGDAMALTSGERTTLANVIEAEIIDDTDSEKVLRAITDKIAAVNPDLSGLTLAAIASAIRTELATELARIDAAISTRLATASYTAPDNASAVTAAAQSTAAATQATGANTKAGAIQTILAGITSLAQWLGLIAGKQTGNTTARTELRATGAGSGTFDETTDSTQAIRDRGDAAWTTGGGGGGSSTVVIGPVAATVNDVAIAANTGGVIYPLSMFKAQRATIVFAVVDGDSEPIDMTGDDLAFVIHGSDGTTIAEINNTNEPAQFVIGDSGAVGATGDQITLTIEPTQNTQTPGDYEYKLWNTTLDAVIATGKYRIKHAPQS